MNEVERQVYVQMFGCEPEKDSSPVLHFKRRRGRPRKEISTTVPKIKKVIKKNERKQLPSNKTDMFVEDERLKHFFSEDFNCHERMDEYDSDDDRSNPLFQYDNMTVSEYIQKISNYNSKSSSYSSSSSNSSSNSSYNSSSSSNSTSNSNPFNNEKDEECQEHELPFGTRYFELIVRKPFVFERKRGRKSKNNSDRFSYLIE